MKWNIDEMTSKEVWNYINVAFLYDNIHLWVADLWTLALYPHTIFKCSQRYRCSIKSRWHDHSQAWMYQDKSCSWQNDFGLTYGIKKIKYQVKLGPFSFFEIFYFWSVHKIKSQKTPKTLGYLFFTITLINKKWNKSFFIFWFCIINWISNYDGLS